MKEQGGIVMKVVRVNGYNSAGKTVFKGYKKYLIENQYGEMVLQDKKPKYISEVQDQSEFLLKGAYPNSSVERTLDTFHSKPTGVVYYADPLEGISDKLREQVDYVVYDNEPKYPDVNGEVSENYFGTKRVDYGKKFAEIRDYYYRLEMADSREAEKYKRNILAGIDVDKSKEKMDYYNDRIAKSKYQQWQAAECINLYTKGNYLRMHKERMEDTVQAFENDIKWYQSELPKKKALLKESREQLANEKSILNMLELKKKAYNKAQILNAYIALDSQEAKNYAQENDSVERFMERAEKEIKEQESAVKELETTISWCKNYIINLPGRIAEIRRKIKDTNFNIEQAKKGLIPVFDELKNFYAKQKILH